jgi:hypothetical protein
MCKKNHNARTVASARCAVKAAAGYAEMKTNHLKDPG